MNAINLNLGARQQSSLNTIALHEGKTIGDVITQLIDAFIELKEKKIKEIYDSQILKNIMKLSESSFNQEDEIYNKL